MKEFVACLAISLVVLVSSVFAATGAIVVLVWVLERGGWFS